MNRISKPTPAGRAACPAHNHAETQPHHRWTEWLMLAAATLAFLTLSSRLGLSQMNAYQQTNIVSDGTVTAQQTDPTLVNPWGIAIGQQTPFWINDANAGLSAVYNAAGAKQFAVTVPPKKGSTNPGTPSGIVFNAAGTGFSLPGNTSATFIFVTLDGTISGWNASTPNAIIAVDNSASGAAYTGVTMTTAASGSMLLAANFSKAKIDVFDSKFAPATLAGSFADPNLPAGFGPFGIHNIGGTIYVTYAQLPSAPGPAVTGPGLGYVNAFDMNGNLLNRVASGATLNAPWGVALAPAGFGAFAGNLLVGNFGDGAINAFDATSFAFKGQLQDASGKPIANSGLWELIFGQQGTGDPNTLYFSAGLNNEKGGLFGAITAAKVGPVQGDFTIAPSAPTLSVTAGQSGTVTLDLSAMNSFTGSVTMACSGLPAGSSCTFAPSSVDLTTPTATTTMTVATAARGTGPGQNPYVAGNLMKLGLPIWAAFFPLAFGAAFFRRRRSVTKLWMLLMVVLLGGASLVAAGCGGSKNQAAPTPTPTPTPQATSYPITVTATSGTLTHTAQVMLTVN
ncbi:MAG: TIGR03118 family protein [Acidobacteriaceae bacterium]